MVASPFLFIGLLICACVLYYLKHDLAPRMTLLAQFLPPPRFSERQNGLHNYFELLRVDQLRELRQLNRVRLNKHEYGRCLLASRPPRTPG